MVDLALTEEQRMLDETLERYLAREHSLDERIASGGKGPSGVDRHWSGLAGMGMLAVPVSEEDGGIGGGGTEVAIIAQQLGRNLVATPYLETAVMASSILEACRDAAVRQAIYDEILNGQIVVPAHFEPDSRFDSGRLSATAGPETGGFVLNGEKVSVMWGDCASRLLVSARLDDRVAVFSVDPTAAGVERVAYPTNDGQRGADIRLNDVRLAADSLVVGPAEGSQAVDRAIGRARVFLACEAAAIMRRMCDMTRDYVATRQQFGTAIGNFQVIQHRLVDMYIEAEQSLSIALLSADSWEADEATRDRATSAARALVARAGRFVGQSAVQLHGGIGMAWESPLSHYFKRLTMNGIQMGDESFHLRRFAALAAPDRQAN